MANMAFLGTDETLVKRTQDLPQQRVSPVRAVHIPRLQYGPIKLLFETTNKYDKLHYIKQRRHLEKTLVDICTTHINSFPKCLKHTMVTNGMLTMVHKYNI